MVDLGLSGGALAPPNQQYCLKWNNHQVSVYSRLFRLRKAPLYRCSDFELDKGILIYSIPYWHILKGKGYSAIQDTHNVGGVKNKARGIFISNIIYSSGIGPYRGHIFMRGIGFL